MHRSLFLYFVLVLLSLACFASSARSQCSTTCAGFCFSDLNFVNYGQIYWSCGIR
jgi:hypothetical protein